MSSTYNELIRILGARIDQKKVNRVADTVLQWAGATPDTLTGDKLGGALDFLEGTLEIHLPNDTDRESVLDQLRALS